MQQSLAALELENASRQLLQARTQLEDRLRALHEMWRRASSTDRILAIQRLIQTGALPAEVATDLESHNEVVRGLVGRVRADKRRLAKTPDNYDLKHALFRLELEMQQSETARDDAVAQHDLWGPLFFCSESFVRDHPLKTGELPLKDLAERVGQLETEVADLLRRGDRRGARFTVNEDGAERTLIRMLPALTMSGEGDRERG